jgi:hypothetical protein
MVHLAMPGRIRSVFLLNSQLSDSFFIPPFPAFVIFSISILKLISSFL